MWPWTRRRRDTSLAAGNTRMRKQVADAAAETERVMMTMMTTMMTVLSDVRQRLASDAARHSQSSMHRDARSVDVDSHS